MSIEKEYETYIARLKETVEGERLFLMLPEISQVLYRYSFEVSKEFPMVESALKYLPEKEVLSLLEKNFVLIFGRVLLAAHNFDELDPARKVEKLIDLLTVLKEEQEEWLKDYKEKTKHLHDKAARRERRKEFFHEIRVEDKHFCEASIKALFEKFLPDGLDSLFIPSMAKLFLPKNFLESFVKKNVDSVMKAIHGKTWKEALLFLSITFLFRDVFWKNVPRPVKEDTFHLSEPYREKGVHITSWLLDLLSIADTQIKFLAKQEAMEKAVAMVGGVLASFSVERWLLSVVQRVLFGKGLIGDLDLLIDRVSGDTKSIAFLLKRVVSLTSPAQQLAPQVTLGEILMLGIKGAAIEAAIAEKAASLVYQEIPLKIFQHIRLFVLSSFFDKFVYKNTSHVLM